MSGNPVGYGSIVHVQEVLLFREKLISDFAQPLNNIPSLVFRYRPARKKTDAMFIQQTERTSLELGEDVESGRGANFFGTERGQIIRWKRYATEVFSDELLSGRLEGESGPADERARRKRDFQSIMRRGVTHKIPPHIAGEIDHLLRYFSRDFREHTVQQVTFNFCFGIAHFHQHEAVHEGDVLTHDALIKPGFVAVAVGVGRHDEAEHGA